MMLVEQFRNHYRQACHCKVDLLLLSFYGELFPDGQNWSLNPHWSQCWSICYKGRLILVQIVKMTKLAKIAKLAKMAKMTKMAQLAN